jgi:antitoxin MazE
MKTRIVKMGKSFGIRLPKFFLAQVGIAGEVEVVVQEKCLVIKPVRKARQGWALAFQKMAQRGDDILLDGDLPPLTSWDNDEWQW